MTRQEICLVLAKHRDDLRTRGVSAISLFGSCARDEAKESSDVDLLVEFGEPIGLFDFLRLQQYLQDLLCVARVDLVTKDTLIDELKDIILAEAIAIA